MSQLSGVLPYVIVPKPSGSIHICVDLKPLNESVMREIHPLPKGRHHTCPANRSQVVHQIRPLAKESRLLKTFITTYERFCFNKLPFRIANALEHFQCRMNETQKITRHGTYAM